MTATRHPTLVVLAAGMGSRYGGLKQIDPVGPGGEIVIDYSVYDALRAGFGRMVFVIRRDIEAAFRSVIEPHFAGRVAVDYVFQELADLPPGHQVPAARSKPWGSAHAIWTCRHALAEPFGVINADDFYGRRSFDILAEQVRALDPATGAYCLVAFPLGNTLSDHGAVSRGICHVDPQGCMETIVEHLAVERHAGGVRFRDGDRWGALTGAEPVSMNMWGFTPVLFDQLGRDFTAFLQRAGDRPKAEFFIPDVVDHAIRRRESRVRVVLSPEKWLGVTYPDDKPAVAHGIRRLIEAGVYPEKLWA